MFEIIFNKQSDIIKWQNLIHDSHMITTPPPLTTKTIAIYDKLKELLDGYIATTDLPTCGFYKDLMNIYPNAKVMYIIFHIYIYMH